jgi:alkanesulfonate monooxygenase SsuD/methylene tetrahydromethanopterin reductase-like flavin-dependent oxidoreductase (luciferase family)
MEFGMQFFPDVGPEEKPAAAYFDEALRLVDLVDEHGYGHIRIIEHYFHRYGGYSPNPIVFLSAAAQRTKKARLITGAVLPVFNNPLKLAGEIGMLDAISGGRLEVGFARAFLPHEFARFGISLDESKARFAEGMEQVRRLLEEENISAEGRFHRFGPTTSLPRPTQRPRPPFWIAALATPDSFAGAGKAGHSIMAIPMAGGMMAELIGLYREAWRSAGHPGKGRVMLAFHMLCHESRAEAEAIAKAPLDRYLRSLVDAASDWTGGVLSSADYPGYDKIIAALRAETFESQVEKGAAWVGAPADIAEQIGEYQRITGGFESASLQVNFNTIPYEAAAASVRLFGREVMPTFRDV